MNLFRTRWTGLKKKGVLSRLCALAMVSPPNSMYSIYKNIYFKGNIYTSSHSGFKESECENDFTAEPSGNQNKPETCRSFNVK